jgi:hypothetical protein
LTKEENHRFEGETHRSEGENHRSDLERDETIEGGEAS